MPRISNYPDTFDDQIYISLATLKRLGWLIGWSSRVMSWVRSGQCIAKIRVSVNLRDCMEPGNFVELDYSVNGSPRTYRVELVSAPSNLGKGEVWFFVCPVTGRRCRKLYLADGLFASRYAQPDTLYENQLWSKSYRQLDNTMGRHLRRDDLYEETFTRYAKRHYRGVPTRRVRRFERLTRSKA